MVRVGVRVRVRIRVKVRVKVKFRVIVRARASLLRGPLRTVHITGPNQPSGRGYTYCLHFTNTDHTHTDPTVTAPPLYYLLGT